jgi:hypothetical protein
MRAFLQPNVLLADRAHYKAALQLDAKTARECFDDWLQSFDTEKVIFHEHKLLAIAANRFPDLVARGDHRGVLANIIRQAKLRAHVASAELSRLMSAPGVARFTLVAIGETHQRVLLGNTDGAHMENIELAVQRDDLPAVVEVLNALGYRLNRPVRQSLWPSPLLATLLSTSYPTLTLRLVGLRKLPDHTPASPEQQGACMMTTEGYRDFMSTRNVRLLRRRDQVVFDIAQAISTAGSIGHELPKPANRSFLRLVDEIIGLG